MVAPTFSVGVDADPMMVEQTIGKSLDEIIKERRKDHKGAAGMGKSHVVRWLYFL